MTSYDVVSGDKSILAVKINSTQTTGIQIAAMTINGTSTAWGNSSGVVQITESSEGSLKVEWLSYTGISTASDNTVTLTGVSRGLTRSQSTLTGTGTGQSFNKGAIVKFVNFHYIYNQKADVDRANTFSADQTIASGSKILFGGSGAYVYTDDSGANIKFKDTSNVETTLSTLTAAAGVDTKARVSNNDTTSGFLNGKLVAGLGVTLSEGNDGGDETLTIARDEDGFFGNGADGDVTISGDTTLSRDMFYDDLIVNSTLNTANFNIYARTISGTGTIRCNGNAATAGTAGSNGLLEVGGAAGSAGTAGAAIAAGSWAASGAGKNGAAGGAGANRNNNGSNASNGTTGANISASLGTDGSAGAAGGAGGADTSFTGGTAGTGGAGGTATASIASVKALPAAISGIVLIAGTPTQVKTSAGGGSGGGGGGGGARDQANVSGGGGGGGGGSGGDGGVVSVSVKTLSGSVVFQALGGAGGNGGAGGTFAAAGGGGGGGGGGGAGGSGGLVLIRYRKNSGWSGSVSVAGGAGGTGGTGGTGDAAGANGSNGATGASGFSLQLQI